MHLGRRWWRSSTATMAMPACLSMSQRLGSWSPSASAALARSPGARFLPSSQTRDEYDVIVVGGGNAALCAAMAARHIVPRVLVLERAPAHMRGGNTRHTRNVRCAHTGA